jgi:hypothetical protein
MGESWMILTSDSGSFPHSLRLAPVRYFWMFHEILSIRFDKTTIYRNLHVFLGFWC